MEQEKKKKLHYCEKCDKIKKLIRDKGRSNIIFKQEIIDILYEEEDY